MPQAEETSDLESDEELGERRKKRPSRFEADGDFDDQADDFQVRMLIRLDQILENQSEQMSLLRRLVTRQGSLHDMEDVLPEPVNTEQQLLALCDRISKEQTFTKQLFYSVHPDTTEDEKEQRVCPQPDRDGS
ncbi:hypothetical protein EOD39_6896 [Acipenser ruthenus]|uniref:Uncharacterized protein n=1 Tax=Acipenser ruthenus TaxID=7906 RepID=A0A444U8W5_ACIRT|nr:hypothetical protein EOD39_6896 [Acipenser ruthenus]